MWIIKCISSEWSRLRHFIQQLAYSFTSTICLNKPTQFNHYETLLSVTSPSKEKNFRCFQYFLSEEVKLHIQRGFIRIISKSLICRSWNMKQLILITESVINHFLPPLIESPQYSTSWLQVHVHPIIHVFYMCIY